MRQCFVGDLEHSVVVGSVSHMDAGWEHQHREFARYLGDARAEAAFSAPSKSVSRVSFDAVRSFIEGEPLNRQYAMSVSVWGSYVRLSQTAGTGVGEVVKSPTPALALQSQVVTEELRFQVNREFALGSLAAFDVQGRRVAFFGDPELLIGKSTTWRCINGDGNPIPAGVYFLRARGIFAGKDVTEIVRFVVLR